MPARDVKKHDYALKRSRGRFELLRQKHTDLLFGAYEEAMEIS
jgi:hypothetical protein